MIYTDKLAFIHVPKTSGLSIKKTILKNCPDATLLPKEQFWWLAEDKKRPEDNLTWRRVMHYPYSHWQDIINDKWVFSVVRDPFVRAISFYVFLQTTDFVTKGVPFEELFSLKNNKDIYYIPTVTQTEILSSKDGTLVPNIFRMEDGYNELESHLGFKIDERENVSPAYNYLDYYDEKREKLIFQIFEKDFENFGYKVTLP